MQLRASEVASAISGRLIGDDVLIDGVHFDSRADIQRCLFVAIRADRNGHDFVPDAFSRGASCALVSEDVDDVAGSLIVVDDTMQAFSDLATHVRSQQLSDVAVVGVTGSVGKTSTKNLIAGALSSTAVWANPKSFNNEQGVPFTLINTPSGARTVVVEMGMRGFGEITHLCDVASPTIGVVTRVGQAHTARLGGIEGVAKAKAELVASLPTSGTAVLNADDERVLAMSAIAPGAVVTYGQHGDVTPTEVQLDAFGRTRFRFDSPWGSAQVALQVAGEHMMSNALAAIAVGGVLKVSLEEIVDGVEAVEPEDHRMVVHELALGSLLIDDCYNANPTSVVAALRTLADLDVSRRIAVLGEMAEVDDPIAAHRSVADTASHLGIEVIPIMTDLYGEEGSDVLPAFVMEMLSTGDTAVLVKGSRVAGLERVVEEILHH